MIALVDAGTGNIRSVVRAVEAAGARGGVEVTADPARVRAADRVLLPGQGAFGEWADALERDGGALGEALREAIAAGRPFLGICLGMQLLFERSEEAPGRAGLGVLPGEVRRLDPGETDPGLKVPHMGWNRAEVAPVGAAMLGDGGWFYFAHSYVAVPADPGVIAARTAHGAPFASAVARDNVFAVQFHPEKSQRVGLDLLRRWLAGAP